MYLTFCYLSLTICILVIVFKSTPKAAGQINLHNKQRKQEAVCLISRESYNKMLFLDLFKKCQNHKICYL